MQAYSTRREFCGKNHNLLRQINSPAKFSDSGNPDNREINLKIAKSELSKVLCGQCNNRMKFVLFDNGMKSLIEGYHCYCCGMNRLREF